MGSLGAVPADPVGFIRECVAGGRILWTYYVNMRMKQRSISRRQVLEACTTFELLEQYSDDKYLPSYLIACRAGDDVFHVLFAVDVDGDNVRVVTAYRPTVEDWGPDLKKRRST